MVVLKINESIMQQSTISMTGLKSQRSGIKSSLKLGSVSIAYNEQRFILPHLNHIPLQDEHKLVLLSSTPWQGEPETPDQTLALIEEQTEANVLQYPWTNEHEQRNTGQEWYQDYDWIIVMDPDEFLTKTDWEILFRELENATASAYVVSKQFTYWKSGYRIEPPEDYKQLIAVRPSVRFVDKRVVNVPYNLMPVTLHHMSWARTDVEVKSKITHYAHAHELDPTWYDRVWKKWTPEMQDLHPLSPEALKQAVPCKLPPELEKLNLWPSN